MNVVMERAGARADVTVMQVNKRVLIHTMAQEVADAGTQKEGDAAAGRPEKVDVIELGKDEQPDVEGEHDACAEDAILRR